MAYVRTVKTASGATAVQIVWMDGFTGFKTAATEELPEALTVMDPFHVVRLAGNALDECRRRIQLTTRGYRGRTNDPLYRSRRTLHTGADLLTGLLTIWLTLWVSGFTPRSKRPG